MRHDANTIAAKLAAQGVAQLARTAARSTPFRSPAVWSARQGQSQHQSEQQRPRQHLTPTPRRKPVAVIHPDGGVQRRTPDNAASAVTTPATTPPGAGARDITSIQRPGHTTASSAASQRRPGQYGRSGGGARANNNHMFPSVGRRRLKRPPEPVVHPSRRRSTAGSHRLPASREAALAMSTSFFIAPTPLSARSVPASFNV